MPFLDSLDIANTALHILGQPKINSVDEDSKSNEVMSFAYDKLRRPELRRNIWRFSIKRVVLRAIDSETRLLDPTVWSSSTSYLRGSIVADDNGGLWSSTLDGVNLANEPGASSAWDQYFGPLSVSRYDDEDGVYSMNELVYTASDTDGSFVVYRSLKSSNSETILEETADWDVDTLYGTGDLVQYLGTYYRSLIPVNLGITPGDGPNDFDIAVNYMTGNTVVASDGYIYSSDGDNNLGNDPGTDDGVIFWTKGEPNAWSSEPDAQDVTLIGWAAIFGGLKRLDIPYTTDAAGRNFFRLPANWLREAPQNPKQGSWSTLGAPSGVGYSDWEYEGDFLVTTEAGPLPYRFVADITFVPKMDDMFCVGMAARMAEDSCEVLTQQDSKVQTAVARYNKVMGEARTVNAIEEGPTEPPEDDYLTVRQ